MNQSEQAQILVVDDTPQNLRLLAEILSAQGYKIRPTISGQVAIRSIAMEAPDLILMDVRMPDMDGYEVCQIIKKNEEHCHIPVIFISALDDVEDKIKGFKAGGVDYITKPFQKEEVLARVKTHLDLWYLQRQMVEKNNQLHQEITERKRAEAALMNAYENIEIQVQERTEELRKAIHQLSEKEAELRGILNAIPDMLFVLSKTGRFLEYVTNTQDDLYLPPEEFLNKSIEEVMPDALASLMIDNITQTLMTGKTRIYEYQLPIHDVDKYFEAHMAVAAQEQVVCIVRDITARKQIEETIRRVNNELEIKVRDRTQELQTMNQNLISMNTELEHAYAELANTQKQMLQQEKMACIGQLAAGVAHEINNPLGFIVSNLSTLKSYTESYTKLYELLKMDLTFENQNNSISSDRVREYLNQSKFLFINEDINDLFKDTREGLERVSKIVKSLRWFARIDTASECEPYDLNVEIENVLTITQSALKDVAELQCEFGELPKLHGNGSQINQVLLNLILNASSAIKQKYLVSKGNIIIRTWQEDDMVNLRIRDDGVGIEPERINEIFNPFFTTKQVGDGTGMGLTISYDIIVNKHSGKIDVLSEFGKWTEFTIALPIK